MYQQGLWEEPKISFVLGNATTNSYVTLGGLPDESAYTGKFVHQPNSSQNVKWWTVVVTNIKVGNRTIKDTLSHNRQAIVDTGASMIAMLETDYANFETTIQAASSDFICDAQAYNFCYSEKNTCDAYWAQMEPLTFYL